MISRVDNKKNETVVLWERHRNTWRGRTQKYETGRKRQKDEKLKGLLSVFNRLMGKKSSSGCFEDRNSIRDPPCAAASGSAGASAVASSWWNLWTLSLTKTGSPRERNASEAPGKSRSFFCIKLSIWASRSAWDRCSSPGSYLWTWTKSWLWPSSFVIRDKRSPAQTDREEQERMQIK